MDRPNGRERHRLRERLIERDGATCHWCGAEDRPLTLDRVQPGHDGGTYELGNLVLACDGCNRLRGHTKAARWATSSTLKHRRRDVIMQKVAKTFSQKHF